MDPMRCNCGNGLRSAYLRWGAMLTACAPGVWSSFGCGYQAVAEELTQKNRIDSPGQRLIEGSFRDLKLIVDGDALHLAADTDAGRALTVFNLLEQSSCELPMVPAYSVYYRTTTSQARVLPYLEAVNEQGRGTLKFASLDCQPYGLVVPDAELPLDGAGARGLAVRSGNSLLLVDPVSGSQQVLVAEYMQAFPYSVSEKTGWVVQGDGRVVLFDADWNEMARLGDGVDSLLGNSYFTDRVGLYRIDVAGATAALIQADACAARYGRGDTPPVIFYYSPCAEQRLWVWDEVKAKTSALSVVAEPGIVQYVDRESFSGVFFLRDVDLTNGLGTLWVWTPDGNETRIGERADIDWAQWREYELGSPEQKRADLLALVDVAGETGRLIDWQLGGSAQEIATGVWRWSRWGAPMLGGNPILINSAGAAGDLAVVCRRGQCAADGGGATLAAKNVQQNTLLVAGEDYKTRTGAGAALALADFDGSSGTLISLVPSASAGQIFRPIAQGVPPAWFALLSPSLFVGTVYLADYDLEQKSGRLEYRNFDLDAVGTVATGVTEYIGVVLPDPGLLYVVGEGERRGIWRARGK